MCDLGVGEEDDLMEHIDWEQLLPDDSLVIDDSSFFDASSEEFSNPSPDPSLSLSLDEIEQLLMNDNGIDGAHEIAYGFLLDDLVESPAEPDRSSGEVVDDSQKSSSPEVENNNNNNTDEGEEDDPVAKKRRRREKNRDAAVRSRERRKMYVKDLEMKSSYFEGECRRLGMILNCVIAENQALRLSLQSSKAFDASMTKQESAVLFLESLLLGSLLWFPGIMCLLILSELLRSTQEENVENRGCLTPRKAVRSKIFELQEFQSFMMSKRCKSSRSRIKSSSLTPEVLV